MEIFTIDRKEGDFITIYKEPFEWWKATYNPTQEQITAYGQDVERVRAAMKAE